MLNLTVQVFSYKLKPLAATNLLAHQNTKVFRVKLPCTTREIDKVFVEFSIYPRM